MLAGLDLNLLPTLHALLELRNVTRAGARVRLSQPATSASLARLRRHFGDELLVRSGRGYVLTPLSQLLLPLVTEALLGIERAMEVQPTFTPATSSHAFSVAASDYAVTMLMRPLRRLLRAEAPGVAVDFSPMPMPLLDDELLRRDLLVGPIGYGLSTRHDVLFRDEFVCVLDSANPAMARAGSVAPDVVQLLRTLPHAVAFFGNSVATLADRLLDELSIQPRVAATVTGLLALPLLVRGTDLIALVPRRLVRQHAAQGGLAVLEVPGADRLPLREAVYWHPSRTSDPALQWLRALLLQAGRDLGEAST